MTDANLMDADCIHGLTWWECYDCETDQLALEALMANDDGCPND